MGDSLRMSKIAVIFSLFVLGTFIFGTSAQDAQECSKDCEAKNGTCFWKPPGKKYKKIGACSVGKKEDGGMVCSCGNCFVLKDSMGEKPTGGNSTGGGKPTGGKPKCKNNKRCRKMKGKCLTAERLQQAMTLSGSFGVTRILAVAAGSRRVIKEERNQRNQRNLRNQPEGSLAPANPPVARRREESVWPR